MMNPIFETSVQLINAIPKAIACQQLHPQKTLQLVIIYQICPAVR